MKARCLTLVFLIFLFAIQPVQTYATGEWLMYQHDSKRTGRADSTDTIYVLADCDLIAYYPNGTVKWYYYYGDYLEFSTVALDTNGILYFGEQSGRLHAVYASNGTTKWNFTTGDYIRSTPAIDSDGVIYFGSDDNKFYALWPNGTQKWSYTTGGDIISSPCIDSNGIIYVGSYDSKLYAFWPNGTVKWTKTTGGPIEISSPCVDSNGVIYIGSNDNKLWAVYPNGTTKWTYTTLCDVSSSPVIGDDGCILFGSFWYEDGKFYSLWPNGTKRWDTGDIAVDIDTAAIGSDGTIYLPLCANVMLKAYYPNGTEKWSIECEQAAGVSIGSDGILYVPNAQVVDWGLSAYYPNGTLKWNQYIGAIIDFAPAIGDPTGSVSNYSLSLRLFNQNSSLLKSGALRGANMTVVMNNGSDYIELATYSSATTATWCNYTGITASSVTGKVYWNNIWAANFSTAMTADKILDVTTRVFSINATLPGMEGYYPLDFAIDCGTVEQMSWLQPAIMLSFSASSNRTGNLLCKMNVTNLYSLIGIPIYIKLSGTFYISGSAYWIGYSGGLFSFYIPFTGTGMMPVNTSWTSIPSEGGGGGGGGGGTGKRLLVHVRIRGNVPIRNAAVTLKKQIWSIPSVWSTQAQTQTDPTGTATFTIPEGSTGTYQASASALGMNTQTSAPFDISTATSLTLELQPSNQTVLTDFTDKVIGLLENATISIINQTIRLYNTIALETGRSPIAYIPFPEIPTFDGILISREPVVFYDRYAIRYEFLVEGDAEPHARAFGRLALDGNRFVYGVFVENLTKINFQYNFTQRGLYAFSSSQPYLYQQVNPTQNLTIVYTGLANCSAKFKRTLIVYAQPSQAVNSFMSPMKLGQISMAFGWLIVLIIALCTYVYSEYRDHGTVASVIYSLSAGLFMAMLLNLMPEYSLGVLDIPLSLCGIAGVLVYVTFTGGGSKEPMVVELNK